MQWKGCNDIVYSYSLPVEKLVIESDLPIPGRVNDSRTTTPKRLQSTQPEVVGPQTPLASRPPNAAATSNSSMPSEVNAIKEIDSLLERVEVLSNAVPSIDVRLSKVAGIFPPGHGPDSDAVKEAAQLDASFIDNFKSAITFMRRGFAEFGRKHDLVFTSHEKHGIRDQDGGASGGTGLRNDRFFKSSFVGQRESDAEVTFFYYFLHAHVLWI